MRPLTACLALIGATLLFAAEEPKVKWHKAILKDTKAEALFPGKPIEKTRKGGGQVLLQALEGKGFYVLDGARFATKIDTADKAAVDQVFAKVRAATTKGFKAKLVSEKAIALGKHSGRDFVFEAPELGALRVRAFVTAEVFYQVLVAGPKELVESADAKKFFASFRVPD